MARLDARILATMLTCRAVLFDMDGTLIDSSQASDDLWRAWARRKSVDPAPILALHHGRRPEETLALTYPALATASEAAWIQKAGEEYLDGVRAMPGAVELLDLIESSGGRWAVVTSASRALATARLRAAGLWRDQQLVCAEDVRRGKPDPEGYLAAGRSLGAEPEDCVVFEDAPAGIEAALRAGMRAIAVLSTHPVEQLGSTWSVVDLTAVTVSSPRAGRMSLGLL